MLQKHSKDIIFIVIILILIGIIWGVEKNIWLLIAINVVVIMVGLLYVNVTEGDTENFNKPKGKTNNYFSIKNIAEVEIDDFLNEVDYDDFESVKKGKEILDKIEVGADVDSVVNKVRKICNYDIEIYYLGLTAICMADTNQLKEKDYEYITVGVKLIKSSKKIETRLTAFLKKNNI